MKKLDKMLTSTKAAVLINKLQAIFDKIPKLPLKIVAFFVFLAPWLALLGAVLGVITGPLMAVLSLLSLVTLDIGLIASMLFETLIVLLSTYVLIRAFKPLRKKEELGWIMLFWGNIIGLISTVNNNITEAATLQSWGITALTTVIGLYVLYNMRNSYKGGSNFNKETHSEVREKVQGRDFV